MALYKGTTPITAVYKGTTLFTGLYLGTNPMNNNIYVDSVAGSNANDGKTAGTAKQTIAGITLANSTTINLKRGSKWRETLDTTAYTGMVVQDYGSGVLPVLDCSDVIANSGWTQPNAGTYPNVWQKVLTTDASIAGNFASIWVNNVRLKFVADIATTNSTSGSFTTTGTSNGQYTGTSTTFQINSGSNPNSDGKVYEYAARNYGYIGANAARVSNIHTRRNAHNNGSFVGGANATVNGCIFEDGSKHNAYVSPGTIMSDCIAWKCDWQSSLRDGWIGIVSHNAVNTGVETTTFNRCQIIAELPFLNAAPVNGMTGFYHHTNGSPANNVWGRITYNDCSAIYCQVAFSGVNCLGVTHNRTHIRGCLEGIDCPDENNTAVNYLTDCWVEESDGLQIGRGVSPSGTTYIDGHRHWGLTGGNTGMIYSATSTRITNVTRSAFARTGSIGTGYHTFISYSPGGTLSMTGSVMWGDNTGFGEEGIVSGVTTLNHNAYGGIHMDMAVNSISAETGPYITSAQAAGSEASSVGLSTNPFTNPAAGDFSLTGGSGLNTSVYGLARFPTYQTILTTGAVAAM